MSNSSEVEVGFNIMYSSECSQTISLVEGKQVQIKSPNYPNNYFNNLTCLWTIIAPTSLKNIKLTTDVFSIEGTSNKNTYCADYSVVISTENDGSKKESGVYCNNNKPPTEMLFIADKLFLSFKTDFISSDKGFSFYVISDAKTTPAVKTTGIQQTFGTKISVNNSKQSNITQISLEKVKSDEDDTWTVIIISAFSAFLFFLFVVIVGMNVRRCVNNRNDINAHCAKIAAEEKKKKSRKLAKLNKEYLEKTVSDVVVTSPTKVRYEDTETDVMLPKDSHNNESVYADEQLSGAANSLELNVGSLGADSIDIHDSNNDIASPLDEVDGNGECSSYDSSSLQVHSPLRTSVIDGEALSNVDESIV